MLKKSLALLLLTLLMLPFCGCASPDSASPPPIEDAVPDTQYDDMSYLRGYYYYFTREYRFDYVPFFEEGQAPTQSAPYLNYAFLRNGWGEIKGVMSREYIDSVVSTYFGVTELEHVTAPRMWNYDGEKYTSVPQGLNTEPIYVLKEYCTQIENGVKIYEITFDFYGDDIIFSDAEKPKLRQKIVDNDLEGLNLFSTETFRFYLSPETGEVRFLSHTLLEEYR